MEKKKLIQGAIKHKGSLKTFRKFYGGGRILEWADGNAEKLIQKYLGVKGNEVFNQNELINKGDYYIGSENSGDGDTVFIDVCFGDEFEKHENNLEKNYEYFTRYAEDISDNMKYDVTVMSNSDANTIMFQFTDWFPEESEEPDYDEYADGGQMSDKVKNSIGGEIEWGEYLGDGFSVGNDVYITDSKSMYQGKIGFVSGLIGNDLLVTISENGNERSVFVSKKGVEKLDAPEFAKGGKVKKDIKELENWSMDMAKGGMTNKNPPKKELDEFFEYVKSFYGHNGVRENDFPPKGASDEKIKGSINVYMTRVKYDGVKWGGGDSIDRERVKEIMITNYSDKMGEGGYTPRKKESKFKAPSLDEIRKWSDDELTDLRWASEKLSQNRGENAMMIQNWFNTLNKRVNMIRLERGMKKFAYGGMTPGRYYQDNKGQEFRFVGESEGKLLFKDGEKVISKSEEDFEDMPQEKKLFKFFRLGGEMAEPEESQEYYASMQYAEGGRIKVGTFNEEQLINKEDKKAVEKAREETGLKYVDTKIIKKGGKMYMEVYLIPNEEYYNSSKFADGGTMAKGGETDKVMRYRNKLVQINVDKDEPAIDFAIKVIDMLIDGQLVPAMAKGGQTDEYKKVIRYRNKLVQINVGKDEPALDFAIKVIDMLLDGELVPSMAKGGTFDSKVNAIAKKLEGKPVPAPYRKEYGTRYDKEDAKEAASRIVGNMRKMYGE